MKPFYIKTPIFFGALTLVTSGWSQTLFQDARGESSLFLPGSGGFFQINTKKGTGTLSILRDISNRANFYGFEITGNLAGDSTTLFDGRNFSPDTSLKLTLGHRFTDLKAAAQNRFRQKFHIDLPDPSGANFEAQVRFLLGVGAGDQLPAELYLNGKLDPDLVTAYVNEPANYTKLSRASLFFASNASSIALQLGMRRAQYKMYDAAMPAGSQLSTADFDGYSANLAYNQFYGPSLFGLSVGFVRDNNVEDLKLVDVLQQTTVVNGGVTTVFQTSSKAYRGILQRVDRVPLNADFAIFPNDSGPFVIDFFARMDLNDRSSFVPGISFLTTKKGSPLETLGGLSFAVRDGRIQTALVAGFSF